MGDTRSGPIVDWSLLVLIENERDEKMRTQSKRCFLSVLCTRVDGHDLGRGHDGRSLSFK